nr:unnamed protein product [Spirometra erinaceieuropaei]
MVSSDIASTFAHIPQDLAVESIKLLPKNKYNETEQRLGYARISQPMKFCLKTYLKSGRTIYEKVKDTSIGSPISVLIAGPTTVGVAGLSTTQIRSLSSICVSLGFLAEAILQRLESLVFQHHRPKFWARYVDDTLVVIERDQVLTFKEHLNAVFPDIQFTMEEEEENKFAEAEILLARGGNRVSRELLESWFTGRQSINKCNELPIPYSVLKLRLGGVINNAGSAHVNIFSPTPGSERQMVTPRSNARDEIAAINDANVGHQTISTPRATIPDDHRTSTEADITTSGGRAFQASSTLLAKNLRVQPGLDN